jgi:hypothetical protein
LHGAGPEMKIQEICFTVINVVWDLSSMVGSGSLYEKSFHRKFLTEHLLTEKQFDRTPFGRTSFEQTSFDRKAI